MSKRDHEHDDDDKKNHHHSLEKELADWLRKKLLGGAAGGGAGKRKPKPGEEEETEGEDREGKRGAANDDDIAEGEGRAKPRGGFMSRLIGEGEEVGGGLIKRLGKSSVARFAGGSALELAVTAAVALGFHEVEDYLAEKAKGDEGNKDAKPEAKAEQQGAVGGSIPADALRDHERQKQLAAAQPASAEAATPGSPTASDTASDAAAPTTATAAAVMGGSALVGAVGSTLLLRKGTSLSDAPGVAPASAEAPEAADAPKTGNSEKSGTYVSEPSKSPSNPPILSENPPNSAPRASVPTTAASSAAHAPVIAASPSSETPQPLASAEAAQATAPRPVGSAAHAGSPPQHAEIRPAAQTAKPAGLSGAEHIEPKPAPRVKAPRIRAAEPKKKFKLRVSDCAHTAGKGLRDLINPGIALALTAIDAFGELQDAYGAMITGEISKTEFHKDVVEILGDAAGSLAGTLLLGRLGEVLGATAGSVLGPVGAVAGGAIGDIGGSIVGGEVGGELGHGLGSLLANEILSETPSPAAASGSADHPQITHTPNASPALPLPPTPPATAPALSVSPETTKALRDGVREGDAAGGAGKPIAEAGAFKPYEVSEAGPLTIPPPSLSTSASSVSTPTVTVPPPAGETMKPDAKVAAQMGEISGIAQSQPVAGKGHSANRKGVYNLRVGKTKLRIETIAAASEPLAHPSQQTISNARVFVDNKPASPAEAQQAKQLWIDWLSHSNAKRRADTTPAAATGEVKANGASIESGASISANGNHTPAPVNAAANGKQENIDDKVKALAAKAGGGAAGGFVSAAVNDLVSAGMIPVRAVGEMGHAIGNFYDGPSKPGTAGPLPDGETPDYIANQLGKRRIDQGLIGSLQQRASRARTAAKNGQSAVTVSSGADGAQVNGPDQSPTSAPSEDQGTPGVFMQQGTGGEAQFRPLLDLIGNSEGTDRGRSYNETVAYGAYTGGQVDLTNMSLSQVLALQKRMLANPANRLHSSAVGRYQFISSTLRELTKELKLDPKTTKFTPEVQDRLAQQLIMQNGGRDFLAGRITAQQFQDKIASQWASIPRADTGASAYGQRTGASSVQVAEALSQIKPGNANDMQTANSGPPGAISTSPPLPSPAAPQTVSASGAGLASSIIPAASAATTSDGPGDGSGAAAPIVTASGASVSPPAGLMPPAAAPLVAASGTDQPGVRDMVDAKLQQLDRDRQQAQSDSQMGAGPATLSNTPIPAPLRSVGATPGVQMPTGGGAMTGPAQNTVPIATHNFSLLLACLNAGFYT